MYSLWKRGVGAWTVGGDEDLLKGAHLAFMARLDIPLDVDLERWPPEAI